MIDEQEIALQRASDRMVREGIIYCVSSLIDTLWRELPDLTDWENFYPMTTFDITYRCNYCKHGWVIEDAENEDEVGNCPKCGCEAEPYTFDEHHREVFEYWIVDAWMAEKLKQEGELIVEDFMDGAIGYIWCRTCTGQAISMDYVMRKLAKEYYLDKSTQGD